MNHHVHSHNHNQKNNDLSLKEKLSSLLQHWIDHNVSHKESYLSWAAKAEKENFSDIVSCLEQAGQLTDKINIEFEKALKKIS